jgi:hypothetical protein
MQIHTFYCMYVITWQKRDRQPTKDSCKFSLHFTKEEADNSLCRYYQKLPQPLPTTYYVSVGHPKFVKAIIIQEEDILSI